jgi:hypothetical protein
MVLVHRMANIKIQKTGAVVAASAKRLFPASDLERYPYPASRREVAASGTGREYHEGMQRKYQRTLELIFSRPVSGSLPWRDIEALFQELGGEVSERAGSRVAVVLFGEVRVFHRPHPSPNTDKGAVASIRKWFEEHGVTP